jgi:hypothetical protein
MSVGEWMGLMFLTALPCVGVIVILILAFMGENETRKNYFRAMIAWFLILLGIGLILVLLGTGPDILKKIQSLRHPGS